MVSADFGKGPRGCSWGARSLSIRYPQHVEGRVFAACFYGLSHSVFGGGGDVFGARILGAMFWEGTCNVFEGPGSQRYYSVFLEYPRRVRMVPEGWFWCLFFFLFVE